MTEYISITDSERVGGWTNREEFAIGMIAVDNLPEDFHKHPLADWVYSDGEFTLDPLPIPEPEPSPVEIAQKTADEAKADAAEAKETADQALEAAQTAGNPQVATFAALMMPTVTPTMTASDIASIYTLLPEWKVGASYKKGEAFSYQGKTYRAAQDIPEAQEIYPPGPGMESLYTLIDIAPDGIRVWHMPTDATNSFANGEKAHYPDADGPIYVSKRDGNTSEPGTDEWWEPAE